MNVSGLRAHGILLDGIDAFIHDPILVSRTDRVTVRELLLTQRRHVAGGDQPGIFTGLRDRERPIRTALPLVLHSLRDPVTSIHEGLANLFLSFAIASASPHIFRPVTRILAHSLTVRLVSKHGQWSS